MPFTRISLHAGKSSDYLSAIADSLDQALVECFDVPPHDRFAVFHQHQPGELIFDRTYRGQGGRSDDFIVFHITSGNVRSAETKRRFFRRLVANLAKSPGIRPEDVMVTIINSTLEDWSFASGISAAMPSEDLGK